MVPSKTTPVYFGPFSVITIWHAKRGNEPSKYEESQSAIVISKHMGWNAFRRHIHKLCCYFSDFLTPLVPNFNHIIIYFNNSFGLEDLVWLEIVTSSWPFIDFQIIRIKLIFLKKGFQHTYFAWKLQSRQKQLRSSTEVASWKPARAF